MTLPFEETDAHLVRSQNGQTPLLLACRSDNKDLVLTLLDHGACPNVVCTMSRV
jgi:ankyrin repeat protein